MTRRPMRFILLFTVPLLLAACAGGTASTGQRGSTSWERDLDRAEAAFNAGDYQGAVRAINAVMRRYEGEPEGWASIYMLRAFALLELGRYGEALSDAERAVRLAPNEGDTYFVRGRANQGLRRHRAAVLDFNRSLRLRPDPDVYYYRGTSLALLERYRRAIDDMTLYLEANPRSASGWYRLGLIYSLQGDRTRAIASLAVSLRLDPDNDEARKTMAELGCRYESFVDGRCP